MDKGRQGLMKSQKFRGVTWDKVKQVMMMMMMMMMMMCLCVCFI